MAGKTPPKAKPRAKSRTRTQAARIPLVVTKMSEEKITEIMGRCGELQGELRFLLVHLLVEQRQRAHERRMATLKQLGSAVAYAPVQAAKLVSQGIGFMRGVPGRLKRRFARPQEATSS